MNAPDDQTTGLFDSLRRLTDSGLALVHNRAELLAVELQEEKGRLLEVLLWMAVFLFFGIVFFLVITATIVFLFPSALRIYVAGGFSLLYLIGAVWAFGNFKSRMASSLPLAQTINETKKDREIFIGEFAGRT